MTRSTVGTSGTPMRLAPSPLFAGALACSLVCLAALGACKKKQVTCTAEVIDGARSAKASLSAEPKPDGSPPDGLERAAEKAACRALCEAGPAEQRALGLDACAARCNTDVVAHKLGARTVCVGAP